MIEFLTLFLGIVAGPQDVALLADETVVQIELRVDSESVARIEGPPWEAEIDLGTDLLPHMLEAVGFDSGGMEVARATQFLNLPRPTAEVSLILRRRSEGRSEARLAWETASGSRPTDKIALLDDKEVPILDGDSIDLSSYDFQQLHVLQVELWFPDLTSARGHLVFGGEYVDETSAELTAWPVMPTKGSLRAADMDGWFVSKGERLQVAAVEKGLASLMVVRGPGVSGSLHSLIGVPKSAPQGQSSGLGSIQGRIDPTTADLQKSALSFADEIRVRLVVPRALKSTGRQIDFELFSVSPEIRSKQGGLFWILSQDVQVGGVASRTRLSDAVTLAGLQAAGSNHRRAVLVILAAPWTDESRFEVATVRRYLEALQVPLIVWSIDDGTPSEDEWGEVETIASYGDLKRAWRSLEKSLNRQRIVWLEGIHLSNAVEIAPGARVASVVGDNEH